MKARERPWGELSDFVVEQLPTFLAEARPLGPVVQEQLPRLVLRGSAEVALLDLKMIEAAIVHSSEAPSPELVGLIDERVGQEVAGLTYEEIVLVNPPHDRRLFTGGEVAVTEAAFYEAHRQIEEYLTSAIGLVKTAAEQLTTGASVEQVAGQLVGISAELDPVVELTRKLGQMPAGHFAEFRRYLASHPQRNLKGPSGAFSPTVPVLELMYRGGMLPPEYFAYLRDNERYFPRRSREDMRQAVVSAEIGRSLASQYQALGEPSALRQPLETLAEFFTAFRRQHYRSVARQVPEALKGTVAGTGGERNVRSFLRGRMQVPKVVSPVRVALTSDYSISRVIKGSWQLAGGHGPVVRRSALRDMERFVKAGITTFDCADIYTGVEELIGDFRQAYASRYGENALRQIQVHTKFVPDRESLSSFTDEEVCRSIDRSLHRLRMDQLDLVQFHWWDYQVPGYVEVVQQLAELQRQGKIRYLGVTNFDVAHLRELVAAGVKFLTHQVQYSLLDRRPEHGLADFCQQEGIHLLCYGTLAGGFLSGRYLGVPPPGQLENRSLAKYRLIIDEFGGWGMFQMLLRVVDDIARKHRVSISTVCSRFILDQPGVAGVIVGVRDSKHLEELRRLSECRLDQSDREVIAQVLAKTRSLPGDVYGLERMPSGPHASIMRYDLNRERI